MLEVFFNISLGAHWDTGLRKSFLKASKPPHYFCNRNTLARMFKNQKLVDLIYSLLVLALRDRCYLEHYLDAGIPLYCDGVTEDTKEQKRGILQLPFNA